MIWRRDERTEQPAAPAQPAPAEREREREHPRQERHEGRRRMAEDREVTILGQGASLEGNIVSAGSLRIDGQIKGQINSEGDVTLSERSQVEADIAAENATVAGRFKGNIRVKGTAELVRGGLPRCCNLPCLYWVRVGWPSARMRPASVHSGGG